MFLPKQDTARVDILNALTVQQVCGGKHIGIYIYIYIYIYVYSPLRNFRKSEAPVGIIGSSPSRTSSPEEPVSSEEDSLSPRPGSSLESEKTTDLYD